MTAAKRYSGESLSHKPHIVVLGSCKVGNFVVSTPVLAGLKKRFPESYIGFLGSSVTEALEQAHPAVDWRLSWDNPSAEAGLYLQKKIREMKDLRGPVELAVNLDGFNPVTCMLAAWLHPRFVAGGSLTQDLRRKLPWGDLPQQRFLEDPDWDSPDFLQRYDGEFDSNYIAELFCQLAFVADQVNCAAIDLPRQAPGFDVPDLLIHCTTARGAKIWPFRFWEKVINYASLQGWTVGLVGSPPRAQREAYNAGDGEEWLFSVTDLIDLRGKTTLLELAGACEQARAVMSVDAGPLHIAAAVGTPTLAVVGNDSNGVGASPIRLWLPRSSNVSRTMAKATCEGCQERKFRNDDCFVRGHPCMNSVLPEQVINWLNHQLED